MTETEIAQAYDDYHAEYREMLNQLAKELDCDRACAEDVHYLRTRARHTPELEQRLIKLHKAGNPPNICEYGCKSIDISLTAHKLGRLLLQGDDIPVCLTKEFWTLTRVEQKAGFVSLLSDND